MGVAQGQVVRDGRRLPFVAITKDALRVLDEAFPKPAELRQARSVYLALIEIANRGQSDTFAAGRPHIASISGVGVKTLDRLVPRLEEAGIVTVKRRRELGVNLPNVWTLTDPPSTVLGVASVQTHPGAADATPSVGQTPGVGPNRRSVEEPPAKEEERTPRRDATNASPVDSPTPNPDASHALRLGGFTAAEIESARADIDRALRDLNLPADLDWDALGHLIARYRSEATHGDRPASMIRFVCRRQAGPPRAGARSSGPTVSTELAARIAKYDEATIVDDGTGAQPFIT